MIALLVLGPETLAAFRNARRGRVQTSLNLALGSAMASIGLTIPAIALATIWLEGPLAEGLAHAHSDIDLRIVTPKEASDEIAAQVGVTEGSLRTAGPRLRREFGELLRADVAVIARTSQEFINVLSLVTLVLACDDAVVKVISPPSAVSPRSLVARQGILICSKYFWSSRI